MYVYVIIVGSSEYSGDLDIISTLQYDTIELELLANIRDCVPLMTH